MRRRREERIRQLMDHSSDKFESILTSSSAWDATAAQYSAMAAKTQFTQGLPLSVLLLLPLPLPLPLALLLT